MYADGTMKKILAKWKMCAFALKSRARRLSRRVARLAHSTGTSSGSGSSHPDHVFVRALCATVYIAVLAQFFGVRPRPRRGAHAHVAAPRAAVAVGLLRARSSAARR